MRTSINGTSGNDVLIADHTHKLLKGNGGNDTFQFTKHGFDNFGRTGSHDHNNDHIRIMDFNAGDKLDLSLLDVSPSDITITNSRKIQVSVDDGHDYTIILGQGFKHFDMSDILF